MPKKKKKSFVDPSSEAFDGAPENAFDIVNKYGTYEIQPTNGMQNEYPSIGQGETYKKSDTGKKKQ